MSEVGEVLTQLEQRKARFELSVGGHSLAVTNLDKVLWPGDGRDNRCLHPP